jgi:hypothetical protein
VGVVSEWAKGVSRTNGALPYAWVTWEDDATLGAQVGVTSTSWARYSAYVATTAEQYVDMKWNDASLVQQHGTTHSYAAQLELGVKYPSSYFPIANGAENQTRTADVLVCSSPSLLAPSGFFTRIDLTFAPNFASTEYVADHNLVFFDTNNRIFLRQTDNKVVLRLGGADIVSNAAAWSREAALRVVAVHTKAGRRLLIAVNGATVSDSGIQSAAAAVSLPGSVGILGTGSATAECSDLRRLAFR